MQRLNVKNTNVILFSQWSRKSYAVFASLKKVVNIARLSVDINVDSLIKNTSLVRLLSALMTDNDNDENDDIQNINDYNNDIKLMPIVIKSDYVPFSGQIKSRL